MVESCLGDSLSRNEELREDCVEIPDHSHMMKRHIDKVKRILLLLCSLIKVAHMSIIQVSVGTHAYICCFAYVLMKLNLTIIINLKYNIYVNTYCYVVRALQNIAHNGLWEL